MAVYDADDLKLLFSLFDADRNGHLGKQEIKELVDFISGERTDDDDVARFMQYIDTNKDEIITIDEFEILVKKYLRIMSLGVRNLFNSFDLNGDGYVDKDEFNQVIQNKSGLLHERKMKFFKKILTRDDGDRVSYQQFIENAMEHYRNYVANRDN